MRKLEIMQEIQIALFEHGLESEVTVTPIPCLKIFNKNSLPVVITHDKTDEQDLSVMLHDAKEGKL